MFADDDIIQESINSRAAEITTLKINTNNLARRVDTLEYNKIPLLR